jgi:uncharacterized protein YkwD
MRRILMPLTIAACVTACYGDGDLTYDPDTGLPVVPGADASRVDRDTEPSRDPSDDSDDGDITIPDAGPGERDAVSDAEVQPDLPPADDWPSDWAALEDRVVVLVNQRRAAGARCGGQTFPAADPVVMNAELRDAARAHGEDMAARGYFDHIAPDGSDPFVRIEAAGYRGGFPQGENIAAGYQDAASVVDGWMGSPGHCANIMERGYGAIGVGVVFDPASEMGAYWVQTFGARP